MWTPVPVPALLKIVVQLPGLHVINVKHLCHTAIGPSGPLAVYLFERKINCGQFPDAHNYFFLIDWINSLHFNKLSPNGYK